jgi:hypothetical protein
MQALLGRASRAARYHQRVLASRNWRRPYADGAEELTPVRLDWISAVPLVMIAIISADRPEAVSDAGARRLGCASARSWKYQADRNREFLLGSDPASLNQTRRFFSCLSMISSENRTPPFGIMV